MALEEWSWGIKGKGCISCGAGYSNYERGRIGEGGKERKRRCLGEEEKG